MSTPPSFRSARPGWALATAGVLAISCSCAHPSRTSSPAIASARAGIVDFASIHFGRAPEDRLYAEARIEGPSHRAEPLTMVLVQPGQAQGGEPISVECDRQGSIAVCNGYDAAGWSGGGSRAVGWQRARLHEGDATIELRAGDALIARTSFKLVEMPTSGGDRTLVVDPARMAFTVRGSGDHYVLNVPRVRRYLNPTMGRENIEYPSPYVVAAWSKNNALVSVEYIPIPVAMPDEPLLDTVATVVNPPLLALHATKTETSRRHQVQFNIARSTETAEGRWALSIFAGHSRTKGGEIEKLHPLYAFDVVPAAPKLDSVRTGEIARRFVAAALPGLDLAKALETSFAALPGMKLEAADRWSDPWVCALTFDKHGPEWFEKNAQLLLASTGARPRWLAHQKKMEEMAKTHAPGCVVRSLPEELGALAGLLP